MLTGEGSRREGQVEILDPGPAPREPMESFPMFSLGLQHCDSVPSCTHSIPVMWEVWDGSLEE